MFWVVGMWLLTGQSHKSLLTILYNILISRNPALGRTLGRTTKAVLSRWGIFVAIAKNTLCVKIIDFSYMPKIIKQFSKDHIP